ncbi:MAG: septum formation initiator family protein [Armatimonadota bacterium]
MALLRRGRRGRWVMKKRTVWALAGAICGIGIVWLSGPLGTIREQSARMAQLQAVKASLLSQQQVLEKERRFLATEAGREAVARRVGYVRPGERRLVFVPAASGAKKDGSAPEKQAAEKKR